MTLRALLEFKIFGVDGFHIEGLFCNIKSIQAKKGVVTIEDLKGSVKMSSEKMSAAIKTLESDGFIKIKDDEITIIKEIDYSKNEQCDV